MVQYCFLVSDWESLGISGMKDGGNLDTFLVNFL